MSRFLLAAVALIAASVGTLRAALPEKPNIIFILADDLGYGDLGCFGQKLIKTPNLDAMAAQGMRFTQSYSGTSVCAPARCTLMTGLHTGHSHIRANREYKPEGQEPLPAGTFTVARLMKDAGYTTACIGKWGLGSQESTGQPNKMGFDHFFGYICQRQAHEYYPDHLWRNAQRVDLDKKAYSHDLMAAEALQWIRANSAKPFFLYLPFTIPHGKWQVPDQGAYANQSWPEVARNYAAMVTRMDGDIGRVLALLKELKIDEKTLVIFASDNGQDNKAIVEAFNCQGGLRGSKRTMYEGGFRSPSIARWPGVIQPGSVSEQVWAFWDVLPTCAQLAGASLPPEVKTDGISIVPALLGQPMARRDYLYWELHEGRFIQAIRQGDLKAVRNGPNAAIEIYDLKADPQEKNDLAGSRPELVQQFDAMLKSARTDSPLWPIKAGAAKKK